MKEAVRLERGPVGIAHLVWALPEEPENLLRVEAVAAFERLLDQTLEDASVRGLVVRSGKANFIVGGDLHALRRAKERSAAHLFERVRGLQSALRKLERASKPVAIVLDGAALGGGFELALAGHRRFATRRASVGLPELRLGLIPGAGGPARLARILSGAGAYDFIRSGKPVSAEAALGRGLVDGVFEDAEAALEAAISWISSGAHSDAQLESRASRTAPELVEPPKTPAERALAHVLVQGSRLSFERALELEARSFVQLARSDAVQNRIETGFFAVRRAEKLEGRPMGPPKVEHRRMLVLGSGQMASGIALQGALRGLEVTILARSSASADRVLAYARRASRKRPRELEAALGRLHPTTDLVDAKGCELVVEAVVESSSVKREQLERVLPVVGADALWASTTSTLPITGLAAHSPRPDRFIGLHFFSPVERQRLVEVVPGARTSAATLAEGLDLVARLGRVPIQVTDTRGFFTSRVFGCYLAEGMAMLLEGVPAPLIDRAGRRAGMPLGPLELTDLISIELLWAVDAENAAALGTKYVPRPSRPVLERMRAFGRLGRKAGGGFYDYPERGPRRLWSELAVHFPPAESCPPLEEVSDRLLDIQAVEAERCISEGVVSPRDADVGSVLGLSFPVERGGVATYARGPGRDAFLARCRRWARAHGARFALP